MLMVEELGVLINDIDYWFTDQELDRGGRYDFREESGKRYSSRVFSNIFPRTSRKRCGVDCSKEKSCCWINE